MIASGFDALNIQGSTFMYEGKFLAAIEVY